MKIFNWVHRKFHQNVDSYGFSLRKDGLGQNVKKTETVTHEADTDTLLDHVTLVDVPEGWQGGLLSIGTLGFHPSKPFNDLNDFSVQKTEEEEEECSVTEEEKNTAAAAAAEEEGELSPLVVKAFKREFEKVLGSNPHSDNEAIRPGQPSIVEDTPLIRFLELTQLKTDSDNSESDKKKKGERRTTLADLFSAETDVTEKLESGDFQQDSVKKLACRTKHGLSFTKKFLPRKGEDSRPITKLHRLVTKMLKRKIHPELEGKVHGMDSAVNALKTDICNKVLGEDVTYNSREGDAVNESLSLLQDGVFGS